MTLVRLNEIEHGLILNDSSNSIYKVFELSDLIKSNTLLQVNATIIAGILIFLTISSLVSNDITLSQNPILPLLDGKIESEEESLAQSANLTSRQNKQRIISELYNIRQIFELELRTEQLWERTDNIVIILGVTTGSLIPFVISSALILGNSDRIRWAPRFTKYGLFVVIIALATFQGYYLWEAYNAGVQVQTFKDEYFS